MRLAARLRRPTLVLAPVLALLGLALACTDDSSIAEDAGGETLGGDTDELPDGLGEPARGLSIVALEVNQGTGVEIVRAGEAVPVSERNATLITGRDTLVRVAHVIDDPEAWVARELVGILHILPPDGPERIRVRSFVVEADSDPRRLTTGFYFSLLAAEAQAGTRVWVELREAEPVELGALAPGDAETPIVELGLDPTPAQLRVVLVPVRYEYPDPPREPDITAADLQLFSELLLQQNPVQRVELEVRDQAIVRSEQLLNLGELLAPTRAAKLEDGAAANVYYHALVDVGGPAVSQVAGIATLPDASKDASADRIAATVYYKHTVTPDEDAEDPTPVVYPPAASARTFVHEIGHNQGFRHVACPNANAAGPDPDYPHADGKIGVHGFGIRDFHIYTPGAAHDYMSYCGNSWVSDWTWDKAFARITTLTAWDYESTSTRADGPAVTPALVGIVGADGRESWVVSVADPAALDRTTSDPRFTGELELVGADATPTRVPARVERLSDETTVMITAPLPVELASLRAITWIHAGQRRPVPVSALRR